MGHTPEREQRMLRTIILEAAYRLLCAGGEEAESVRVVIRGADCGLRVVLETRPGELPLLRAAADLPEAQANIVQAMTELGPGPHTAAQVAKRAGYKLNSRFYTEFRAVQQARLIVRTPDGYRLADPVGDGRTGSRLSHPPPT